MFAILHALGMLLADLFKSRSRLEAENLFLRVVKNGRVSRIDVAVDLPGVRMDQFLFLAHQGATNRQFATNGHLETFYFATSKGNQTRIYSKKKEQLAKGKSFGKSVVRVERTLRNLNMTIAELHQLKAPFIKMVASSDH
jgi:hypothetical protein